MNRNLLRLTLSLFCLHLYVQPLYSQTERTTLSRIYPAPGQLAGREGGILSHTKPGTEAPTPKAAQVLIPNYPLGRSTNAYTFIRNSQNQLAADPVTGFVAFIHRQDVTVHGGGGAASGYLRVDYSTDYGNNWTVEDGPMQLNYTHPARYPQLALYRDPNTTQPLDNHFVWSAPTFDGTTNWLGQVCGVTEPGIGPRTENYLFYPDPTLIAGSLTKGLPGEFWNCEFVVRNNLLEDTLVLYHGVWNATSQDVEWTIKHRIPVGGDRIFDGTLYFTQPVIAFSPDGFMGWVAFLGDLSETAAPAGQDSTAFAPVLIRTTDGGQTWGAPMELNLNQVSWLRDTLLHGPVDSLGNPLASGIATTAFELDLVVDGNGEAHIGAVIGNGGGDYSLEEGGKKFLGHIFTQNAGSSWGLEFMNPIYTLRGTVGSGSDPLVYDNRIQATRNETGEYVLFSFADTDTSVTGFGNTVNAMPDVYLTGKRLQDNYTLCKWPITESDIIYGGKAYFTTISPEFFIRSSGRFIVPMVLMTLTTGDPLQPCGFEWIGPRFAIDVNSFCEPMNYLLGRGWQSPFYGFCRKSSIADGNALAEGKLTLVPNPTQSWTELQVEWPAGQSIQFALMDLTGRILQQWNHTQMEEIYTHRLDLSALPAGIYRLNAIGGGKQLTQSVVVQH